MRSLRALCFTLVIAAAACTSEPTPTATPVTPPPTDIPAEVTTPPDAAIQLATQAASNQIIITPPPVGTVRIDDHSGTPNYTPVPFDFQMVTFTRSGGITGELIIMRLYSDGRLQINDAESRLDPAQVEAVRAALDQVQFFDIQGTFTGPDSLPDAYQYSLGVLGSRGAVTISLQDGYIPPELQPIIEMFVQLIASA